MDGLATGRRLLGQGVDDVSAKLPLAMTHAAAVIGAGLAGLACARRLVDAGLRVSVFDKGIRRRDPSRTSEPAPGAERRDDGWRSGGRPDRPVLDRPVRFRASAAGRAPEWVGLALQESLAALLDFRALPLFGQAHRWRFARVARAAATPFAWNSTLRLGACGDWRLGPSAECAWLSGNQLAAAILSR